jgi:hypothetical protein
MRRQGSAGEGREMMTGFKFAISKGALNRSREAAPAKRESLDESGLHS